MTKSSGKMANRRVLSNFQDYGYPDGMCQDTDGGIWTCRWQAGKVIRLTESGDIDVIIDFPTAWHMTCCIFGGKLDSDLHPKRRNKYLTQSPFRREQRRALCHYRCIGLQW